MIRSATNLRERDDLLDLRVADYELLVRPARAEVPDLAFLAALLLPKVSHDVDAEVGDHEEPADEAVVPQVLDALLLPPLVFFLDVRMIL